MIPVENKKVWIYGAVSVAVVLAFGLYWYFFVTDSGPSTEETIEAISQSGAEIQTETNPVKNIPNLNPAEKINPFKTKNPFE